MQIDDMTLIAYLDAQLEDDADYERVEQALADDARVRARLQALVESGESARRAFDVKLEEAVPPALIATVMNAPFPGGESVKVREVRRDRLQDRLMAWMGRSLGGAAAFASFATLVIGVLVGQHLLPVATGTPSDAIALAREGDIVREDGLRVALETAPSGRSLQLDDVRLEVTMSYLDGRGQACREYSAGRAARVDLGVACREGDSQWRIVFVASEPRIDQADGGVYATASDRLQEAVNDFLTGHLVGEPIDAERERRFLERAWAH